MQFFLRSKELSSKLYCTTRISHILLRISACMKHQHLTVSIAKTILTFLPICWFGLALFKFHQLKRAWALILAFAGHAWLLLLQGVFSSLVFVLGLGLACAHWLFKIFWFLLLLCLGRRRLPVLSLFPLHIHPCLLWRYCCVNFCEKKCSRVK